VVATGRMLKETTKSLKSFMERRDGRFDWALDHNSTFEMSKVAVMHCQLKLRKPTDCLNPTLRLRGRVIKEVGSYKYLGIHIDGQLQWKIQENEVMAKATSYILMFRRLTHTNLGI